MSHSVKMPALGESVTEGTVTRWLKAEGDQVAEDEPLLEVSTDKVDTEIPSPASGTVLRIVVAEDETAAVGAELAVIGDASEGSGGGGDAAAPEPAAPAEPEPSRRPRPQPDAGARGGGAVGPARRGAIDRDRAAPGGPERRPGLRAAARERP